MVSPSTRIKRAVISVSDKTKLECLAQFLHNYGVEILATGGTYQALKTIGIPAIKISDYTEFSEILDGRVKTLHPRIYGGILSRPGKDDDCLKQHNIKKIDLVIVNLYPFQQTIANPKHTFEKAIENIDIGGPCMLRAAAKNHQHVLVVVDPLDYPTIQKHIEYDQLDADFRRSLAAKAYTHTSTYDAAITNYLTRDDSSFPNTLNLTLSKVQQLRYGENPHQQAAFYSDGGNQGFTNATLHQGKQLSYNNLADADAAYQTVTDLMSPSCCIVKHANPCGVSSQETQLQSYIQAYNSDSESAFGGIISFNTQLELEVAEAILERGFIEVIIAPGYSPASLKILTQKPNIRVLEMTSSNSPTRTLHNIAGGILMQDADQITLDKKAMQVVSKLQPNKQQWQDLLFAWKIIKYIKSNAIVYATNQTTLGVGAGQSSRVNSARIAQIKAEQMNFKLKGSVMASDAFFPFRDSIDTAANIGVSAIIHPGGSIRDQEVIDAANEHGISLITTGVRHFKH